MKVRQGAEDVQEQMGGGVHNCVACGRRGRLGFYSIPQDPARRRMWLKRCDMDPASPIAPSARLCKLHFTKDDFLVSRRRAMLKKEAIPTIKVDPDKSRYHRCCRSKSCYVCGALNTEYHSFHRIPYDPEIREQWLKNVGIKFSDFNPIPQGDIRLCEMHFNEGDFIIHPQTKSRRLRRGAMPFLTASSNTLDNQSKQPASWSMEMKKNNDEDSDSSVTFISSSSKNVTCVIVDDEEEEPSTLKISDTTTSKGTENIFNKKASDQSNISLSRKKNCTIDLTLDDVEDSNNIEPRPKKKKNRICLLKKKNARLKKKIAAHKSLLDDLLKNKFVTKKGKKMIKAKLIKRRKVTVMFSVVL